MITAPTQQDLASIVVLSVLTVTWLLFFTVHPLAGVRHDADKLHFRTYFSMIVFIGLGIWMYAFSYVAFLTAYVITLLVYYACFLKTRISKLLGQVKTYQKKRVDLNHSVFRGQHKGKMLSELIGPDPMHDAAWVKAYIETLMLHNSVAASVVFLAVLLPASWHAFH